MHHPARETTPRETHTQLQHESLRPPAKKKEKKAARVGGGGNGIYMMDSINERRLNHSVEEGRDVLASVTGVTSLDEVGELSVSPSTCEITRETKISAPTTRVRTRNMSGLTVGVGELEGVKEGGGGLEVGSAGDQLVDQVLNTDEAVLAQSLLDDRVVVQGDPLSGDLGVTSLVDELLDGLEVGLTIGEEGTKIRMRKIDVEGRWM